MVASPYLPTYARHPLYVPLAETRRLHGYNIETPLGDDKMERRNTRPDKSEVESNNFFGYVLVFEKSKSIQRQIWKRVKFLSLMHPRLKLKFFENEERLVNYDILFLRSDVNFKVNNLIYTELKKI